MDNSNFTSVMNKFLDVLVFFASIKVMIMKKIALLTLFLSAMTIKYKNLDI